MCVAAARAADLSIYNEIHSRSQVRTNKRRVGQLRQGDIGPLAVSKGPAGQGVGHAPVRDESDDAVLAYFGFARTPRRDEAVNS